MSNKSSVALMVAVLLCAALPAWSQDTLPEENGKQAVQTYCMQCHDLSRVTRAGYDQEGWRNNIHMMLNGGAILPQDEIELGRNIWPSTSQRGRSRTPVIPGSVWPLYENGSPTPGSRPHDPLATPDDSIWYQVNSPTCSGGWSHYGPDHGISPPDAACRAAWPGCRQRRQHLVYGQLQKSHRQARSENRTGDRISYTRSSRT